MPTKIHTKIVSLSGYRKSANSLKQGDISSKSAEFVQSDEIAEGSGKGSENKGLKTKCRVPNYVRDDSKCRVVSCRSNASKTDVETDKRPPIPVSHYEAKATPYQIRYDADNRRKELPTLYPANYGAWEWMNKRGINMLAQVHRSWQRRRGQNGFANFLRDMADVGIKQREGDTLDREDTRDPRYAPGLCRFVPHKVQSNNTSRNRDVFDPTSGTWTTATLAAENNGLKPGTILKALERKADAGTIIQAHLDKRKPKFTSRGKVALTPSSAQEVTQPIPAPPAREAADPTMRWPWRLTGAQRDTWTQLYLSGRIQCPKGSGLFEWRHEFALRFLENEMHRAGFNLPGRAGAVPGILHSMRDAWDGEPTDEEWTEYEKRLAYFEKCRERRIDLLEKLPRIEASLAGKSRDKDPAHQRTYTHYHQSVE